MDQQIIYQLNCQMHKHAEFQEEVPCTKNLLVGVSHKPGGQNLLVEVSHKPGGQLCINMRTVPAGL